jgi:geranylgeranyl diphosphate synthase, type II
VNEHHFQRRYSVLRKIIDRKLASIAKEAEPRDLYDATRYVLAAPGKRVRPTLLLLSCGAVGGNIRHALQAAAAIEMLHNFTLVHDDVMDNAPSRRGRATVHSKWDVNNAILVGDVMLGLAYRQLLRSPSANTPRVVRLLTEAFVDVCEGQALDVKSERRISFGLRDYYRMIDKKTGTMIATSTEMGGVLGNGGGQEVRALRAFGMHIGRAFQIQDDLLDVVAKEEKLGKRIGGDIVEGKKTFLLTAAINRARGKDRTFLRSLALERFARQNPAQERVLINRATSSYKKYGVLDEATRQIRRETAAGIRTLEALPTTEDRLMLQWFAQTMVQRTF